MTTNRITPKSSDLIGNFLPNVEIDRVTLESPGTSDSITTTVDFSVHDVMDEEVFMATRDYIRGDFTDHLSSQIFQQACKVVIIVTTSARADGIMKALFIQQAGQRASFRDRVAGISGRDVIPGSIPEAIAQIVRARDDIHFFTETVRSHNGRTVTAEKSQHYRQLDSDNNPVYKYCKDITIPNISSRTRHMSVHAFTFMDFSIFDLDIGPTDLLFLNSLYGLPVKTTVLKEGVVDPYKMVLLDEKGTPYTGPFHIMEDGRYMSGRFHSDATTQYLTDIMVPNLIVQDFRGLQRSETDLYLPTMLPSFLQKNHQLKFLSDVNSNRFNARAEIDQDPSTGEVTFEFMVDQEQIFKTNSKYGYMYDKLPNSVKYSILRPRDYFRLVDIKILRRRVKPQAGTNTLGQSSYDVFDREVPDVIVAQTGERGSVERFTNRFDEEDLLIVRQGSSGIVSDETMDTISLEASLDNMLPWFQQAVGTPLPIQEDGYPPFPFFRNFIGRDDSLQSVYMGMYQYGIELTYEDGFEKYLKEVLVELKEQTSHLERYHSECNIPLVTTMYTSRAGTREPDAPDFPEYKERVLERSGGVGNYNHITRRFTSSFIQHANQRYDFLKMCRAYFNAVMIVYADAIFRMGNLAEHDNARLTKLKIDTVISLLRPENSRPEQVANVLKSFHEVESLMEDILDIDLIKDSSNVDLTKGDAASSGRSPKLIKVKRYFGDTDDFVDASLRYQPFAINSVYDLIEPQLLTAVETMPSENQITDIVSQYARSGVIAEFASKFEDLARYANNRSTSKNTDPRKLRNDTVLNVGYKNSNRGRPSLVQMGRSQILRKSTPNSLVDKMEEIAKNSGMNARPHLARGRRRRAKGIGSHRVTAAQISALWSMEEAKFGLKSEKVSYDSYPVAFSANSFVLNPEAAFSYSSEPSSIFNLNFGVIQNEGNSDSSEMLIDKIVAVSSEQSSKSSTGVPRQIDYAAIFSSGISGGSKGRQRDILVNMINEAKAENLNKFFFSSEVTDTVDSMFLEDETTSFCEVIPVEPREKIPIVLRGGFVKQQAASVKAGAPAKSTHRLLASASKSKTKQQVDKESILVRKVGDKVNRIGKEKISIKSVPDIIPQIHKLSLDGKAVAKKGQLASKSVYGTMKKVQKLVGFEKDIKGKPLLAKPVYKDVKVSQVKSGLKPGKYKMVAFSDESVGAVAPPKMSTGKKYFTVSKELSVSGIKLEPPKQSSGIYEQIASSAQKILAPASPGSLDVSNTVAARKITLKATKEVQDKKRQAEKVLGKKQRKVLDSGDNPNKSFVPSGGKIQKKQARKNSLAPKVTPKVGAKKSSGGLGGGNITGVIKGAGSGLGSIPSGGGSGGGY